MEGKAIDSLKIHDYSQTPRHVTRYVGESASLRIFNPDDRIDMQRAKAIGDALPEEFAEAGLPGWKLIRETRKNRPGRKRADEYAFAIVGSEKVPKDEIGEVQGFVKIYPNEEVEELIADGKLPPEINPEDILEITYAKNATAASGQIASGVRQVCMQMSQISSKLHPESSQPQFTIIASVAPDNEASIRVLDASGFINKGDSYYVSEDDPTQKRHYLTYVLDWDKLHDIMQAKAKENSDQPLDSTSQSK